MGKDSSHQDLECCHCGQQLRSSQVKSGFCCSGCKIVYSLIKTKKLDQFYQLKDIKTRPLFDYFQRKKDFSWVKDLAGFKEGHVQFQVEGIQCAACVWLIQELARKQGTSDITINANLGLIHLKFDPQNFSLEDFIASLHSFSYPCAPTLSKPSEDENSLKLRMGICIAIAMNSMFLSFSIYLGLDESHLALFEFFKSSNFFLSILSILVGGSYFFAKSFLALRKGILHFDIPISLGILGAFLGSSYGYFSQNEMNSYFDSLNIFIALMLSGRFLQERLLKSNRNRLLEQAPLSQHEVILKGKQLKKITFSEIKAGDQLQLPPAGIVAVDSQLVSPKKIECSLAWINGESQGRTYHCGETIPSGAQVLGMASCQVQAQQNFQGSMLECLSLTHQPNTESAIPFWNLFTRYYVILLLSLGSLAFLIWYQISGLNQALSVLISLWVITCPCSIGIAIPLARFMAIRQAQSEGIFIRNNKALDYINKVKHVIFDKTGTLSFKIFKVTHPEIFSQINTLDLKLLYNAVSQSQHPIALSLFEELYPQNIPAMELAITEVPGEGIHFSHEGQKYFIGKQEKQKDLESSLSHCYFMKDNTELSHIFFKERILSSAAELIEKLKKADMTVHLLSGDNKNQVLATAKELGIPLENTRFNYSPFEKESYLEALKNTSTFMIGDGLNDIKALKKATLSASPLGQQSIVNQNSDLYFTSQDLNCLIRFFELAGRYRRTLRTNLVFTLGYNLSVITLSLLACMTPLGAAILMPVSSLSLISATGYSMRRLR